MARIRDLPRVFTVVSPWDFFKRVLREMNEDGVFVWASALAYAWLFAIFPFFIFLLTLLPYLPQAVKDQAEDAMKTSLDSMLAEQAAATVWQNIYKVIHQPHAGLLSTGILITLWAASGGMNMTMSALDRCYDVPKSRAFYHQRPMAVGLTVVVATLILAVLILLPIGSAVTAFVRQRNIIGVSEGMIVLWNVARYSLALVLMLGVLAILYYFGPAVKQRFYILTPGSVFTITVWLLLGFLFRMYVNRFGKYDQTYGTVGGVAILLLFFYIDAVVLLVGAEINSEVDFALGVPRGSTDFRQPPLLQDAEEVPGNTDHLTETRQIAHSPPLLERK
jgi:membrane protein